MRTNYINQLQRDWEDEYPKPMSKELTPMDRLIIAEMHDLDEQVTTGQISFSRMVEIINEKFAKIIRKKEREAAENSWNESASTMSIESYVNEDDCVGFYDIQIEQAKQKFLNENYPL
jgi:hypothetical protein